MNTGIQTSTATPYGAVTTTNPGQAYKRSRPKDLIGIIAAHHLPFLPWLPCFSGSSEGKNQNGGRCPWSPFYYGGWP